MCKRWGLLSCFPAPLAVPYGWVTVRWMRGGHALCQALVATVRKPAFFVQEELLQQLVSEEKVLKKKSRKNKGGETPKCQKAGPVADKSVEQRSQGSVEEGAQGEPPSDPRHHSGLDQENSSLKDPPAMAEPACEHIVSPGTELSSFLGGQSSEEGWEIMASKSRRYKSKVSHKTGQDLHGGVSLERSTVNSISSSTTTRASSPDGWSSFDSQRQNCFAGSPSVVPMPSPVTAKARRHEADVTVPFASPPANVWTARSGPETEEVDALAPVTGSRYFGCIFFG
jgi:hypothetical protein